MPETDDAAVQEREGTAVAKRQGEEPRRQGVTARVHKTAANKMNDDTGATSGQMSEQQRQNDCKRLTTSEQVD